MTTRIAAMAALLCLALAGTAWASSGGFLIGEIAGKTADPDNTFAVVFDASNGKLWNVSGTFRCPDAADTDPKYAFATNGIKKPPKFAFGKKASATIKVALGYDDADGAHHRAGSVKVTFTETIKQTRAYSAKPKHKGQATGSGTVKLVSAKCTVPTAAWKGKGTFEPN